MQHTEDNREQDTENSTHISPSQHNAQPQHTCTHSYALYSFDFYDEHNISKNSIT